MTAPIWKEALVSPKTSVLDTIQAIEKAHTQMAVVVDDSGRLLGTATDGDIRRGLLRGITLEAPIADVMNLHPRTAHVDDDKVWLVATMRRDLLRALPLLDGERRVVGIQVLADLMQIPVRDNWVVLMAGGEGRRLYPLTKDVPKPLLKVGPKPILQTILERFIEAGFHKFFISVNYLADKLESYFGDGSDFGITIEYLREDQKLGTAGALRLLRERPTVPFFVMNGDILTSVDYNSVLEFHVNHGASATMCVREHALQIPYGVVSVDEWKLRGISEKPVIRNFVNAGIYVLSPESFDVIPKNVFFDMPEVFEALLKNEKVCAAFPVREYWMDVGHLDDFRRANDEFNDVFI